MKFPSRFNGVNVSLLPVKVVTSSSGYLVENVYASLEIAQSVLNFNTLVGPFADKLNGSLCIRFESKEACRLLSE